MIINFLGGGGSVDAYTKAESDAKYATKPVDAYTTSQADAKFSTIEDLEDTEYVVAEAVDKLKTSVGLDAGLNYSSPIASGNTMAQDIIYLNGERQKTIQVSAQSTFRVWANAFHISASSSGYTLQYSMDGTNYTDAQAVGANDELIANGYVRGTYFKLKNNTANVTVTY